MNCPKTGSHVSDQFMALGTLTHITCQSYQLKHMQGRLHRAVGSVVLSVRGQLSEAVIGHKVGVFSTSFKKAVHRQALLSEVHSSTLVRYTQLSFHHLHTQLNPSLEIALFGDACATKWEVKVGRNPQPGRSSPLLMDSAFFSSTRAHVPHTQPVPS